MKNAFILLAGITLVLLGYGTYQGLIVAPREETMGDAQRIFYYHVPAATAAYSLFFVNFVASIIYLWKRNARADAWALAAAEVGLVFATVTLALGMIWARYAWGHWWAWDMRLTTFLVLWLLYISYRMLRRSAEAGSTSVMAAALAVMVFIDVPINYMANLWFRYYVERIAQKIAIVHVQKMGILASFALPAVFFFQSPAEIDLHRQRAF